MSQFEDRQEPEPPEPARQQAEEQGIHFIEDLEERKNASGPVTTLAVGEENGGGW